MNTSVVPEFWRMGIVVPFPIRLEPVKSQGVEAIGYDRAHRLLDIRFPGGAVYRYVEVPPQRHAALRTAESIGGYVNREIKPRYRYQQIR